MSDQDLLEKLAAPFEPGEVRFKPGKISGNRALALAYVDARLVAERLDEVVGIAGWQDKYECLPDGSVVCELSVCIDGQWIRKMDVGSPSEQPDEGDRRKAAFSDALKRAAVKFGIGRYLYRLPQQWADFDPQKRQFVRPPAVATPGQHPGKNASKAAPPVKAPAQPTRKVADEELADILELIDGAIRNGWVAFKEVWEGLDLASRQAVGPERFEKAKAAAKEVDRAATAS